MELYDQVKELILERQTLSNNSSGTTLTYLTVRLSIDMVKLKKVLNELYKEKYIIVRKGINGELIFLNNCKK
jgi:hypothetical protein